MKITINTEVLQKEGLTLGDFLVLLIGYYDANYKESYDKLIRDGTISKNVFRQEDMVLSNNTRNKIADILLKSDEKVINYDLDFDALAEILRLLYPQGNKPGTTHSWQSSREVIAFKLRTDRKSVV